MTELTQFYDLWVWVVGHEADKKRVIVEARPPLTSMDVRNAACRRGFFPWIEYQKIKYRRVSGREERK